MGVSRRQSRLSSSSDSDSDKSRSKSRSSSRSRSRSSTPASRRSRSKSGSRSSSSSSVSSAGSGGQASGKSNVSNTSSGSNKSKKLVKASDRKASTALLNKITDSSDSEDEKETGKRKKSSPEPGLDKERKKEEFIESKDHFDDGLDDDLIGDDEDRQRLEDMTEKEREEELFRRAERREELKVSTICLEFFLICTKPSLLEKI